MERTLLIGGILLAAAAAVSFVVGRTVEVPARSRRAHGVTGEALPASPPHRDRLPRTGGPVREPRYDAGPPAYCQVAFGKGGGARHWLVQSGTLLHVDLDGDGDLVGEGKRVEGSADRDWWVHEDIRLRVGSETYVLRHLVHSSGRSMLTLVDPRGRGWVVSGDERGVLRFADTAETAPILHIDGPLEMGIEAPNQIVREGEGVYGVSAVVGCRGRGPGSFACLQERWIPEEATPEAIAEFPSPGEKHEPVVVGLRLDDRC